MAAPQTVPAIDYRPPSIFREAYGFYGEHFGLVMKLMAGPAVISVAVAWLQHEITFAIMRSLPRGLPLLYYNKALFEMSALNQFRYLVHWLCYCFAFVAICVAVQKLHAGEEPRPADCNNVVRERPTRFLVSSVVLLLIVSLGVGTMILLYFPLSQVQRHFHITLGGNETIWIGFLLVALVTPVLVRLAFTVPLAVTEDLPIRAALKRSDRLSDWRILALTRLVIESEVAGFVAAYFAYWIVGIAGWQGGPGLPFYLAIALAGFAQAPMLIGMAVLLCQAKEDPRILTPH